MIRRILSLAIAIVASVLGYASLWSGGYILVRAAGSFSGPSIDPGAVGLVALGLILLAFAVFTVVISSLGVIVVGAIHLVVGLLSIVTPFQLLEGQRPLPYIFINALFDADSGINFGFVTSVSQGIGLVVGTVMLVGGLAARGRTGVVSTVGRIVSPIVAIFLGIGGLLIVLVQGTHVSTEQFVRLSWDGNPGVIALILLGLLLIAAVVLTTRSSSVGVFVLGAVVIIIGAIAIFQPRAVAQVVFESEALRSSGNQFLMLSASGNVLLIGVILIAVGFGVRIRGRRRPVSTVAPAQEPIPGPYGTVAT
jgi:hypothetical protein